MSVNDELDDIIVNRRMAKLAYEIGALKSNLEEQGFDDEQVFILVRDYALELFITETQRDV
jgi:hypothetical protein